MSPRALPIAFTAAAVGLGFATAAGQTAGDPHPRSRPAGPFIRSLAARVAAGRSARLVSLPRIGRFTVACGRDRRSRVTFRAARLLPTSDLVVSSPRGAAGATLQPSRVRSGASARVVAETWQIAPFAAAGVRVVTVHVAGRATSSGCAASAVAIVGPDQGSTSTREEG
jgi:hypothetical protein